MAPEKVEEIRKLELPKKWQILQLVSLHIFAGAVVACLMLSYGKIEEAIEKGFEAMHKGWGTPAYAIFFAIFVMIGVVSGFLGGIKALQLLIHLIRITKNIKDDE
jgi:hypothetical protein